MFQVRFCTFVWGILGDFVIKRNVEIRKDRFGIY